MNLLDLAILIIFAWTIIRGFSRGIIQEAAMILGLIASFFLASLYYQDLALRLERFLPNHDIILSFFSFIVLFILCIFFFNFLAILAKKAIHLVLLGWLDRALGGLFGFVKGAVIIFILVTILTVFYPKSGPVVENSRFFPFTLSLTEKLKALIPFKIKDDFLEKKEALENLWAGRKRNIKNFQRIPDEKEPRS